MRVLPGVGYAEAATIPSEPGTEPTKPRGVALVRTGTVAATLAVLAGAVALRFVATSKLWLDEALTVNIARLPLRELPEALRRDGAPPLYYVLLHFWMGAFGDSDIAVRALAGVCSVATLPLLWVAAGRLATERPRAVRHAALLLAATSPFAVRYATENRMYSLVALLVAAGVLVVERLLRRPSPIAFLGVALITAALLYTHYWALYLVGVTGIWLVVRAATRRGADRRAALAAIGALVVGALAFVPWLPIFLFQLRHTGTPWAPAGSLADAVHAVTSFAGGATSEGRLLALVYLGLGGLGLFGAALDARRVELDLRTRPRARAIAGVAVGTLLAAVAGSMLSGSGYSDRYASVVFPLVVLVVAAGFATLADRRIRAGLLAVAALCGLVGAVPNAWTSRTDAGRVAAVLARDGRPGDVVAYCPDQLGPAVARLLPAGRYVQLTFPRGTGPQFVDWINYLAVLRGASPAAFVARLEHVAGGDHQIWVVWAPGYRGFGTDCEQIVGGLQADPAFASSQALAPSPVYQPMILERFVPTVAHLSAPSG